MRISIYVKWFVENMTIYNEANSKVQMLFFRKQELLFYDYAAETFKCSL